MNLLIVESPSKAKTLEKYLGTGWRVVASVGHVRDLIPENGSVDVDNDYAMKWQIMPGKEKQIKLITDELKKADNVYLASDPDREGEAIAWHLLDILKDKKALNNKKIYRVAFHEITKKAVLDAIENPREIDQNLVDAYLVRRALDYLIGFGVSPLLWRRNLGKSVGRVQSVAVKIVVDREREIEKFVPKEYWSLNAECTKGKDTFDAKLSQFSGEKIDKMTIESQTQMDNILSKLPVPIATTVSGIEKKKISRKPAAPFITSTIQQEAARKLYFSSKRTMSAAQKLYEQGLITYMRTDSTNLSADSIAGIRGFIEQEYGNNFLPKTPNVYLTKSKNAQEAHEAIRPTRFDSASYSLEGDEAKLYELIWKRTIACQMCNAEFDSVSVDITETKSKSVFHAVGTTRTFDGFMKVYQEDKDEASEDDKESKLPQMSVGDDIIIEKLNSNQHFTQPPARYTEASLVKKLEELGIGRPSTYATIMSTIVDRKYVEQDKQRRFIPTSGGWVISAYLSKYFSDLIDVNFTVKTEDTLDDVSNGKVAKTPALSAFWKPTQKMIDAAKDIKTTEIIDEINSNMKDHLFKESGDKCPKCGTTLSLKLSKYGAFVGCSNYPTCDYTKRLGGGVDNGADSGTTGAGSADVDLGGGILFKTGRFGPYVTNGTKNVSAKKYTSETMTLEIATELLSAEKAKAEAIELGENPKTGKMILFYPDGRFGAYISSNKVNVSVKEQPSLDEAIELINNKKPSAKKSWVKKK
ncbi:MAG: type I DNA topoisomerase [Alphaproteobacteria bacterium]|nr:type I DNA topoisomerase [Alphaproteobacteria bacterium]MBN2675356.1 type I DNA topoisomerase [Alphaproteobacteria bacterium]